MISGSALRAGFVAGLFWSCLPAILCGSQGESLTFVISLLVVGPIIGVFASVPLAGVLPRVGRMGGMVLVVCLLPVYAFVLGAGATLLTMIVEMLCGRGPVFGAPVYMLHSSLVAGGVFAVLSMTSPFAFVTIPGFGLTGLLFHMKLTGNRATPIA